ncbi:BspA family leucine-rich repeat surface protein [Clostridiales bacterium]|nr:BspA family leucine-rich repeat surface protein [Clostridiales bacterium]
MAHRSRIRTMGLILALTFIFGALLSIPLACAANHSDSVEAMLDIGPMVQYKMKSLAINTDPDHTEEVVEIKAIHMADSLPDGFIPSDANTVSSSGSKYPVYIFFDNDNDAAIIYFYTTANTIAMNPYSGYMFSDFKALTDISGIANWDSSNVTNMSGLFCGAKSLPDALALRNWDTSNVTDMSYMFSSATSLMFVDVSNWNTSRVTDMTCMFQVGDSWSANGQLTEILGLGDLDVSNVRDMTCMFYGSAQMTYYDVSRWNVSKVESMNHMFCDNRSLRSLDLSNWDVSSLKTICNMFDDNYELTTIGDVSNWNTSNLIDAGGWLNECHAFVGDNTGTLDLSGWDTSNLKAAGEMFSSTHVRIIDLSGWTFDSITNDLWDGAGRGIYYETGNSREGFEGLSQMFKYTSWLTNVYVSQSGQDSYNRALEKGIATLDMWYGSKSKDFTVKID